MTEPKPKAPEVVANVEPEKATPDVEPEKATPDADTVTLSLDQLGELIAAKVAEAVAALPKAEVSQAAPAVAFQNITFDKGTGQPRVVMTLGDPDTDGRVETRTVQERHAHILEALGWTRQS